MKTQLTLKFIKIFSSQKYQHVESSANIYEFGRQIYTLTSVQIEYIIIIGKSNHLDFNFFCVCVGKYSCKFKNQEKICGTPEFTKLII